jgi:hypothetical protein
MKKPTLKVGEPTITTAHNRTAQHYTALAGAAHNDPVQIRAAWFDEYPIGPSNWYTSNGPLQMGYASTRPDDRITLADIQRAKKTLEAASVNYSKPAQVGGSHYSKLKIDPFTYAMENDLDVFQFSVVKYVTRFRDKNGVEDLRKAIDCLQRLIAHEEKRK